MPLLPPNPARLHVLPQRGARALHTARVHYIRSIFLFYLKHAIQIERSSGDSCCDPSSCTDLTKAVAHQKFLQMTFQSVVQNSRPVSMDVDSPGDVRVVYTLYNTSEASALAKQTSNTFAPWAGPYDKSYTMFMVEDGIRSAEEMLTDAEAENAACEIHPRMFVLV